MSKELIDIIIIVGTILAVIGIAKFGQYVMNRNSPGPIRWWSVGGKENPNSYQKTIKNTSIKFLEQTVNHRKSALAELCKAGLIKWDEYTILYDELIRWKDAKLKDFEEGNYLYL